MLKFIHISPSLATSHQIQTHLLRTRPLRTRPLRFNRVSPSPSTFPQVQTGFLVFRDNLVRFIHVSPGSFASLRLQTQLTRFRLRHFSTRFRHIFAGSATSSQYLHGFRQISTGSYISPQVQTYFSRFRHIFPGSDTSPLVQTHIP